MSSLQAFGLLHLAFREKSAINVSVSGFEEQVRVYVNNAKCLARSLKAVGIDFCLLTNRKDKLQEYNSDAICELNIVQITFSTDVPTGTRFYSAHFKLDAMKYIGNLGLDYAMLCDLDMLCINKVPQSLLNIINNKTPLVYDISDQVIPAYGHEKIINDLEAITGYRSEGRWFGGEFISGPSMFFRSLADEIDNIYPVYIEFMEALHHVGDEAYTSAAIDVMKKKGAAIGDAGTLGLVGRYWNTKTLHPQKPFEYFEKGFLLHLPADKIILSEMAKSVECGGCPSYWLSEYKKKKYLNSLLRISWLKAVKRLTNRLRAMAESN